MNIYWSEMKQSSDSMSEQKPQPPQTAQLRSFFKTAYFSLEFKYSLLIFYLSLRLKLN